MADEHFEVEQAGKPSPATLGDVLYAKPKSPPAEEEWAGLVQAIAAGDQAALHALYERAHRAVFTLALRLTANRETAEQLTVDVFHDIWRNASAFDAASGSVLGWIMNQARSRALDRLRFARRQKRRGAAHEPPEAEAAADPHDVLQLREEASALQAALTALTPYERQAIETTFFGGLTHAEAAARLHQPLGTIKTRIRSGLHKLRGELCDGAQTERAPGPIQARTADVVHVMRPSRNPCPRSELTCALAAHALAGGEAATAEAHLAGCPDCQLELESLRPVLDRFAAWPTDVLRPPASLQARLARRIAEEAGSKPAARPERRWAEPDWEQVAPGIQCKLVADDAARRRVSMLVRLAPGASYPAHTHAGVEELHLLNGELWIDERKLFPGDYNYGSPGESDERVWSETGCTCVLITSTGDVLR